VGIGDDFPRRRQGAWRLRPHDLTAVNRGPYSRWRPGAKARSRRKPRLKTAVDPQGIGGAATLRHMVVAIVMVNERTQKCRSFTTSDSPSGFHRPMKITSARTESFSAIRRRA
jgi:hypothetical protein